MLVFILTLIGLARAPYNCNRASFPLEAFDAQPNNSKVYLYVSKINSSKTTSSFRTVGLTKFASAFGIRVLADSSVPDFKVIRTATILAELLDIEESGKPYNRELVRALLRKNATIALFSSSKIMSQFSKQKPQELQCFSSAFYIAPASAIKTDTSREKYCPRDSNTKDRSKGLVADFLISKGYPYTYPSNAAIGYKMRSFFKKAQSRKWIDTSASKCRTTKCQEIAFQSWALSSAMATDTCWCEQAGEWKFCTPESLKAGFPELWSTLAPKLTHRGQPQPNGKYVSRVLA